MKRYLLLNFLLLSFFMYAQEAYYKDIDFKLKGTALKSQLSKLITDTHKKELTYKQIWSAIKITDIDPKNPKRVILLYGYNKNSDGNDAYYNSINNNGGNNKQWNREHTYAKSLGRPNLNEEGPGADAHHLRAADVKRNNMRGNLKFVDGKGNSREINGGWYPGDEWKGDVARMMMYMYLRYGARCLPGNVGVGSTAKTPDGMIDTFLKWNVEDPVSEIEIQRNEYLGNANNTYGQGNRNPFIDNPYLATLIWGGDNAENKWGNFINDIKTNENSKDKLKIYTKNNNSIVVASEDTSIKQIKVFNVNGSLIKDYTNSKKLKTIQFTKLKTGVYIVKIIGDKYTIDKKVIIK